MIRKTRVKHIAGHMRAACRVADQKKPGWVAAMGRHVLRQPGHRPCHIVGPAGEGRLRRQPVFDVDAHIALFGKPEHQVVVNLRTGLFVTAHKSAAMHKHDHAGMVCRRRLKNVQHLPWVRAVRQVARHADAAVVGGRQQRRVSVFDHLAVATDVGAPYRANTSHQLLRGQR